MLDIVQRGGVIIVLIIVLSVVAVAIIVERLLYFRKKRGDEDTIMKRLETTLAKGNFDEALAICEAMPSPITNLMKVGIEHRQYSREVIKMAISDAANMEIPRMERFLSTLGTIAHVTPLLGLLGTVTGNIRAFGVLGQTGIGTGDPAVLAGCISEALLTTAAGIIVSIPAIAFYNYLVSRVNHSIIRLENRVNELVLYLRKE